MKRGSLRVELRLDGSLKARYEGHYVEITECGAKTPAPPKPPRKLVAKDHNAGGKSQWMRGFFDQPGLAVWQAVKESNSRG